MSPTRLNRRHYLFTEDLSFSYQFSIQKDCWRVGYVVLNRELRTDRRSKLDFLNAEVRDSELEFIEDAFYA